MIKRLHQNTIAIDFDGVIHQWTGDYGPPSGQLIPGAIEGLRNFVKRGFRVIVFSARLCCLDQDKSRLPLQIAEVEAWLLNNGMFKDIHWHIITGCKPVAALYIDDNALRFESWARVEYQMRGLKLCN